RRGRCPARVARPADRARALARRRTAGHPARPRPGRQGRRLLPPAGPPGGETVEVAFPSGRTADEICTTEIATVAWAAQMGTLTFHPWPVRRSDVDHPPD